MKQKSDLLNKVLFGGIFLSLFIAESGLARPIDNDESGYLSGGRYVLGSSKNSLNTSHIQIEDYDAPEKVFALNFSFNTRGTEMQDDNVKGTTSATWIGIEFDWNVTKWVKAQFIGGYQFAMGNSAVIYGSESSPYTGSGVDEASFTTTAIPSTQISAGIVTTEFNPISSSFSGGGFAGAREVYEFKNGALFGSLKGYQVAPSSSSVANRALDDEKNPFLTIGNLNLGLKTERLEIMVAYAKYDFYGMTSASAKESRYLGNTVTGDQGDGVVSYKYKFRGQEIAASTKFTLRLDDKLSLSGNMTKNDEADAKRNTGWIAKSSYQYNFGRYSIQPSIARFRFEPDLMPAPFSQGGFGFLNRDGYSAELRGKLKKYNFESYIRYVDANEVELKAEQSDRISVIVGLEVKYEIL